MSLMISAYLPELATPLINAVADTRTREERFAANLAAARSSYQSTDDAGEHEIQAASSQQLTPTGPAMTGSADTAPSTSQLMGATTQMGSQVAQAPMQLIGLAASAPQGILQQMGQLSGPLNKAGGGNATSESDGATPSAEPREREADKSDSARETAGAADAGSSPTERAPATEPGSSQAATPQPPRQVHGFGSSET